MNIGRINLPLMLNLIGQICGFSVDKTIISRIQDSFCIDLNRRDCLYYPSNLILCQILTYTICMTFLHRFLIKSSFLAIKSLVMQASTYTLHIVYYLYQHSITFVTQFISKIEDFDF